eukprot:4766544-Amphidinium_carterae.1
MWTHSASGDAVQPRIASTMSRGFQGCNCEFKFLMLCCTEARQVVHTGGNDFIQKIMQAHQFDLQTDKLWRIAVLSGLIADSWAQQNEHMLCCLVTVPFKAKRTWTLSRLNKCLFIPVGMAVFGVSRASQSSTDVARTWSLCTSSEVLDTY